MERAAGSAVLRRGLGPLARARILGDIAALPDPEGEAAHQRPGLASWNALRAARRGTRSHLRPQNAAGMHSRSASPWPRRYSRPHLPAGRGPGDVKDGGAVSGDRIAYALPPPPSR